MTGVRSIAPHSLERRVAGTEVLAFDDEDVPLHDVFGPGTGGLEGRAQVAQHLLGLRGDVPDADDVPFGVDRVLTADVLVRTLPETTATLLNAGFRGKPSGLRNSTRPFIAVEIPSS